jgi:hypothetical protein
MHSLFRTAFTGITIAAVAACASVDIDQAKKLSSAGVASSTSLQAEAKTTAARATAWHDARIFYSVLSTGDVAQLEKPAFKQGAGHLDTLAKLLRKRTNALAGLVTAYKSFQALTDYGAADETEKAASSFFASTNDFLLATQALPPGAGGDIARGIAPISPQASEGLSIGFGFIATEIQKGQIKKASAALRGGVEVLAGALKAERQYAVAARELLALYWSDFRLEARKAGLADYEPAVRELLVQYDLDPAKDLGAAMRRTPRAGRATEELLKARDEASLALIDERYTSLLQLLDDLVKQHKALEAGRPVTVVEILALVQEIEGYYERVRTAGKKSDNVK